MGEAKNRQKNKTPYEIAMEQLQRELANRGQLIEAGWVGLRQAWIPADAPPHQVQDLRWAFMAGAQHLFASIMTILDPGEKETEGDLRRMDLINAELGKFQREMELTLKTKGNA